MADELSNHHFPAASLSEGFPLLPKAATSFHYLAAVQIDSQP
jgi:hypothetical protein